MDLKAWLIVGLLAFVALRGCERVEPGPGPDDETGRKSAEVLAEQQLRAFGRLSAEALEASAADPAKDSNAHGARVTAAIDRAYDAAFDPINRLAEETLGGDGYTPEKQQAFDAAVARGYRKALK